MISKRLFDITASLTGLILLLPLLVVIAFLIRCCMPGPVLFRQYRVGRQGKQFVMVKFRSMELGHHGSTVSVKGESRITRLGAVLRRYKLDELPELWNVFKGEMSLVGPRPHVPGYTDQLKGRQQQVLSIRPGITCPASLKYAHEEELLANQPDPVSYHREVIFPDKVQIYIHYIENRSFGYDLQIILFTLLGKPMQKKMELNSTKKNTNRRGVWGVWHGATKAPGTTPVRIPSFSKQVREAGKQSAYH